jgi:hypothetical protein
MRKDKLDNRDVNVVVITLLESALKEQEIIAKKTTLPFPIPKSIPAALVPVTPVIATEEKWIDAGNNLVVQTLFYNPNGKLITGTKYSNIQTNIELPNSLFEIPTNFAVVSVKNNTDFSIAVAKQSVENLLKHEIQFPPKEPRAQANVQTTGRYIVLGAVILQLIGALVWVILRHKRKQQVP